jgi:peptidoglycan/xylan/chitin deacetylase (PgdA/CDA1 family)
MSNDPADKGSSINGNGMGPMRDMHGYGRDVPIARWPNGARVAINIVLNWEEGSELSFFNGDAKNPQGLLETPATTGPLVRDLAAESVFEYGSRVGVWRLAKLVDEHKIPLTLFTTALALERHEEFAAYVREKKHEPAGHGYRWDRMWEFSREEEKEQIQMAVETIERACGQRPQGWYSRYSASVNTRELLVEEGGFVYDSDAYNDDLPYFTQVAGKKHLIVPYSLTLNDGRFATSPGYADPSGFLDHLKRAFDELWREGESTPKMMSIGLHSRLIGQPARLNALREFIDYANNKGQVWFTRRIDIANYWLEHHK